MEFSEVIRNRYSCKNYSDRPLEQEKLDAILEAGRLAPTAKNLQEQHIYVLKSEQALAAIDAETPCRYHAPVVLAIAFNQEHVFKYPGGKYSSGIEDAAIVTTHLMLAAYNEGVGSCWVNFFDPDKLAEALSLPENEQILALLDLGYPSENGMPLPNHSSRKDLSETVSYL